MEQERWDPRRVEELAPDARSWAAARKLAARPVWSDVGTTGALVWGRCQGSGATPYKVTVDVATSALTCTCPSRKQPCKHGLALALRWARGEDGAAVGTAAEAAEWARQRASRSSAEAARSAPDPEAQRRRLEKRIALMDGGMAELDRWLADVVVDGLAAVRSRPHGWWDRMGARLVDAQMPALADRVRGIPARIAGRDDWADVLLGELGRWYLAVRAWQRRDDLDPADAADLRTFLGWGRGSEEVLAGERVAGRWTVVGVGTAHTGRLVEQRTWLHHDDLGLVVLLDFAAGGAAPATPQLVGSVLQAEAAVYPGRPPRRIRFVEDPVAVGSVGELPDVTVGWARALAGVAPLVAMAPWQGRFGVAVAGVQLVDVDAAPVLVDGAGEAMAVLGVDAWAAVAVTGGRPVEVFAELLDDGVRPLTLRMDGRLVPVPAEEPARPAWQDLR